MELNSHYEDSDTAKEMYTVLASGNNRTEHGRIYDTLRHGTGELADNTTSSAKKCTPLLLWCTLVNSILIGLLIIAVSVSLYMSTNVSKASNSKDVSVGFAVRNPDKNSSGSPLTFQNVIYNTGDDYNVSSGVFTCRHPGLYFFTATIYRTPGVHVGRCEYYVNSIYKLAVSSGTDVNDGYQSGSGSFVYHLKAGDIVMLSNCRGIDHMFYLSSFTGFRVSY